MGFRVWCIGCFLGCRVWGLVVFLFCRFSVWSLVFGSGGLSKQVDTSNKDPPTLQLRGFMVMGKQGNLHRCANRSSRTWTQRTLGGTLVAYGVNMGTT